MRRLRIPQLLCGHLVIFAKGGRFEANLAVAKNCTGMGAQSRDFSRQFQRFKPISDEEGTQTFSVLHAALRVASSSTKSRDGNNAATS
jgi:hypothetical protein